MLNKEPHLYNTISHSVLLFALMLIQGGVRYIISHLMFTNRSEHIDCFTITKRSEKNARIIIMGVVLEIRVNIVVKKHKRSCNIICMKQLWEFKLFIKQKAGRTLYYISLNTSRDINTTHVFSIFYQFCRTITIHCSTIISECTDGFTLLHGLSFMYLHHFFGQVSSAKNSTISFDQHFKR